MHVPQQTAVLILKSLALINAKILPRERLQIPARKGHEGRQRHVASLLGGGQAQRASTDIDMGVSAMVSVRNGSTFSERVGIASMDFAAPRIVHGNLETCHNNGHGAILASSLEMLSPQKRPLLLQEEGVTEWSVVFGL